MDPVFEQDRALQVELLRLAIPDYVSVPQHLRGNADGLRQHYVSVIAYNIWNFALQARMKYATEDGNARYCQNRGGIQNKDFALQNFAIMIFLF